MATRAALASRESKMVSTMRDVGSAFDEASIYAGSFDLVAAMARRRQGHLADDVGEETVAGWPVAT
jgi:nitrate/nitrite transporter NarK